MRLIAWIGALALLALLGLPAHAQPAAYEVFGGIAYSAPQALPGDCIVKIEIREGVTPQGAVVGRGLFSLQGRPFPIPFSILIPGEEVRPGGEYRVRAVIYVEGRLAWASQAIRYVPREQTGDVGVIDLVPVVMAAPEPAPPPPP